MPENVPTQSPVPQLALILIGNFKTTVKRRVEQFFFVASIFKVGSPAEDFGTLNALPPGQILQEIREHFHGEVIYGEDLQVIR